MGVPQRDRSLGPAAPFVLGKGVSEDNRPKSGDIGARASEESDVVIVHGVAEDGDRLEVLRLRNQRIEVGALQKLEHGRPIHGEVVRLQPRPSCPLICDVKVELPEPRGAAPKESSLENATSSADTRRGPAQVASDRYRIGWDLIFGTRPKVESVN
jgi:hypothetical protein